MFRCFKIVALLLVPVCCVACSRSAPETATGESSNDADNTTLASTPVEAQAVVTGTIRSTTVNLGRAEFDGDLAVFEGGDWNGWGFNPSLLIFLFLDDKSPPEGQTITIEPSDGFADTIEPHIHYRWRNAETGDIDVEVTTQDYRLKIEFGSVEEGFLSGFLEFSVPGEETAVSGPFRARVKE